MDMPRKKNDPEPDIEASTARTPAAERIYQFRITLTHTDRPIWRRIQVMNCTLDSLHDYIQTAMGWTNSHMHHFQIKKQLFGDPMLMQENFEGMQYADSTVVRLTDILPKSGRRFRFQYEYDFGDGWEHEILFEGTLAAEQGRRYPRCVEGERACPPEDVGGTGGYQEYLNAIANPKHERHKEFLEWSGPFDPEKFDAQAASKAMQKGLPDWRNEQPI